MKFEIIGVYPVIAPEPCHLIEMVVTQMSGEIDFMQITQPRKGKPKENWQVPYDEAFLNPSGDAFVDALNQYAQPAGRNFRVAFFFHYLDQTASLLSQAGALKIPPETPVPARLNFIQYSTP